MLKLLGTLIEPTDRYSTKSHRISAVVLTALIKVIVSSITPASFVAFGYLTYNHQQYQLLTSPNWTSLQWSVVVAIIWSCMEIGFYFHCLNIKRLFSNISSTPALTWTERLFYLQRVLHHNPTVFESLAKWFHKRDELNSDDDIQLEHIEDWLSWAFFNKLKRNLSQAELCELHGIVMKCVQVDPSLTRRKTATTTSAMGDYKPLEFMMLNLDPIKFQHKPLIGYVVSGSLYLHASNVEN